MAFCNDFREFYRRFATSLIIDILSLQTLEAINFNIGHKSIELKERCKTENANAKWSTNLLLSLLIFVSLAEQSNSDALWCALDSLRPDVLVQ